MPSLPRLRTGYVVRDLAGHVLACDLTLQEAVELTARDRYTLRVTWAPSVVESRYARSTGGGRVSRARGGA